MITGDSPFAIQTVDQEGSVVLRLTGELDIATMPALLASVDEVVGTDLRSVTLDLGGLTFVDVSGLRALLEAARTAEAAEVDFRLCEVSDMARRVIQLARFEALEDAIETVRR